MTAGVALAVRLAAALVHCSGHQLKLPSCHVCVWLCGWAQGLGRGAHAVQALSPAGVAGAFAPRRVQGVLAACRSPPGVLSLESSGLQGDTAANRPSTSLGLQGVLCQGHLVSVDDCAVVYWPADYMCILLFNGVLKLAHHISAVGLSAKFQLWACLSNFSCGCVSASV